MSNTGVESFGSAIIQVCRQIIHNEVASYRGRFLSSEGQMYYTAMRFNSEVMLGPKRVIQAQGRSGRVRLCHTWVRFGERH